MMTAVTGRSEPVDPAEHVGGVAAHLHVVPAPDPLAPGPDERHRTPPGRRRCGAGGRPRRALILLPGGRARYRPESRRPIRFSTTWVTAEKSSRPQPLSTASS